ncbi:tapasin-like [Synchiropus splendidus]|uniref:tapasin-like n=1 Tax=Synchiropus splendidus TaxID=270530 RepID=UPI00237E3EE1|nr:tapasin-like [Synchiropus splendidus]
MANFDTIYKVTLFAATCFTTAWGISCPAVDCWFVKEPARGGGLSSGNTLVKSLLHVRTDARGHSGEFQQDTEGERFYYITDPSATLCHESLHAHRDSVHKPHCEIAPLVPQPASVQWVVSLTDPPLSPPYLQADWLSTSAHGLNDQLVISNILRAPTASREHEVILSITSKTVQVQSRIGEPVLLDCTFWADPKSPLYGSGFAVEWRYQFRGRGHLVLAYDGKKDRLADVQEEGALLDFEALHRERNASLMLQKAKVSHSGTYICAVHLPYLMAQVTVHLQIVEPPTLSISPSPLPLTVPGQSVTVECEATGFTPHTLELSWEFRGSDGKTRQLGSGSISGHRQSVDGTSSQSTRLLLDFSKLDLERDGKVACVAVHPGGTRRASVALNTLGFSAPSMEDSMAMVGVAILLYGLIKIVSWTFSRSDPTEVNDDVNKKQN